MDVRCTLHLGYIIDLGCGLLHPHRAPSLRAQLLVKITEAHFTLEQLRKTQQKETRTAMAAVGCLIIPSAQWESNIHGDKCCAFHSMTCSMTCIETQ